MAKVTLNPFLTSLRGTVAGLTFQLKQSGTIVYSQPYKLQVPSALRTLMLDSWRQSQEMVKVANVQDKAMFYMQCELYPQYLKNAARFEKSALLYMSEIVFYCILLDLNPSIDVVFSLPPSPIRVLSAVVFNNNIYLQFTRPLIVDEEFLIFYISKPYDVAPLYQSRYTSFARIHQYAPALFYLTYLDYPASFPFPNPGQQVIVTFTLFNRVTGHVLPDVTQVLQL